MIRTHKPTAGRMRGGLFTVSSRRITYLIKDEFSTARSAGNINGTAADGTGQTRNVTDSANKLAVSVANGLEYSGATGAGDPGLWYAAVTRAIGLATAWRVKPVSGTHSHQFGVDDDSAGNIRDGVVFIAGGALRVFFNQNQRDILGATYSNNTTYDCLVIQRNPGAWVIVRGGVYSNWSLAFPSVTGTFNPIPATAVGGGVGAGVVYARRVYMARLQNWATQYANATERKATSANNDTINAASGDAIIEHTIVAATGVTQELMVRRTDDNNCVIIRMDQTNSTVRVYEKNAGVETELTGGTTSQTWTNGSSFRVIVSLYGTVIRVTVNTSAKNNSTGSGFNANVTGVKASHAGTDLIAWPISLPSNIASELDSFFPP